ncbi:MAG: hypothetical protein IJY10_05055 [Lachnospiraceae bacterium]|nr:hypothetical protein [Lachnospiraceae bacterium]
MTLHQEELKASAKYLIESVKVQGTDIALLTFDNVARIEAVISLDSNYRNTANAERSPVFKRGSSEYGYIGSTRYWVEQLRTLYKDVKLAQTMEGHGYECVIEHLIKAIDNENSTHLNSDKVGRVAVKERIINTYGTPLELIKALEDIENYPLLTLIATPYVKGENNHFSFASKFCHYLSLFLFEGEDFEDAYPIYDEVLKQSLPLYASFYLNETVKPDEYKCDYKKYVRLIDRIRDAAVEKTHETRISRTGLDHLIWYFHKGN